MTAPTLAISPARTISPIRGVFSPTNFAVRPTALMTTVLCMPGAAYHPNQICPSDAELASLQPIPPLQLLDFILDPAHPLVLDFRVHLRRLYPHRQGLLAFHLPLHSTSRSWHPIIYDMPHP